MQTRSVSQKKRTPPPPTPPVFDYNSNNGFSTSVFGPMIWSSLHMIAYNYPPKPTKLEKRNYARFILGLRHVLPCGACRRNMATTLCTYPLTNDALSSREKLSRWVYGFHDQVNRQLGKKTPITFEEHRDSFERYRATSKKKGTHEGESGCTEPTYTTQKKRCVLTIEPVQETGAEDATPFRIDKRCT
jgi:hypothetical protein